MNHTETNHADDHPFDQSADQVSEQGHQLEEDVETPIEPLDADAVGQTFAFLFAFDVEKMEWTIQLSIPNDVDFASVRYASHGQNLADCSSGQAVDGNTLTTRGGQFQFLVCDLSGNHSKISEITARYIQGREGQAELLDPVFLGKRYVQRLRLVKEVRRAFIFDLWKNEEREIDLGLDAGGLTSRGHITEEFIYTIVRQRSGNASNIFVTKLGEILSIKIWNIADNRRGILNLVVTDSGDIVYRSDADTQDKFRFL